MTTRSGQIILAALIGLLFLSAPALSQPPHELQIEKFDAGITVMPDSTLEVAESIQVRFIGTNWHGIYRKIPVEYVSPQGFNYTLFLTVKSITDGKGNNLQFASSRERNYRKLKISVLNPDNSEQTIRIEYTVSNALRFFEDSGELYWNLTGNEWDVPIQEAAAHIAFPEGTANIRANLFTGGNGSRAQDAGVEVAGSSIDAKARDALRFHEGITIDAVFDKGFVHEPSAAARIGFFFRGNWALGVPILTFLVMFYLWWTKGRDPRVRPIAMQFEPPDQLTPAEAGTLVDNSADLRDITASIVDFAVRGYIQIEEKPNDHMMGLIHDKDYVFHCLKPRAEWTSLKPHERKLLSGMFSTASDAVSISDLHNHFYQYLPDIKSAIFDSLISRGYYRQLPGGVRSSYLGAGIMIAFIVGILGLKIASDFGMAPLTFVLAAVLTGGIICIFGWFMPARTEPGGRALDAVLGFEQFLAQTQSERYSGVTKTPEMFEKFLPFAIALGVEKNWSKTFQGIYTQPPVWYHGNYAAGFYPMIFVSNLGRMSSHTASMMTSSPRSAGVSGFGGGMGSGGGFSGGGFGGGGGGGW